MRKANFNFPAKIYDKVTFEGDDEITAFDEIGFKLKQGQILRVYFEGIIGDDAIPGEIAWNSFGYLYST